MKESRTIWLGEEATAQPRPVEPGGTNRRKAHGPFFAAVVSGCSHSHHYSAGAVLAISGLLMGNAGLSTTVLLHQRLHHRDQLSPFVGLSEEEAAHGQIFIDHFGLA
jgi:hypothetical protein